MRFRALLAILVSACAVLLSACAGSGSVAPAGDRIAAQTNLAEEYKLGVGDKLRVTVFNEASLSGEFAVGANGEISFPLIGNLPAAGQTPLQVAAALQRQLADGYLRDPRVSAEVTAYRPFYILGEVRAPGTYPYVVGLTVMNAIATAEGYTPRANKSLVFVRRLGSDQEVAYKLTPDLMVFPGDTIRLGERFF